ncbi:MAG: GTPase Era [Gammaproteobacteria bacterium]|nr:GTPase Era [Gammaproteobacteria bacterium]
MRAGYAAIVGRPNVGKSTLLNHLLGQKISITSRRPQTTRHRILGISSGSGFQIMYVDTPGLHHAGSRAINKYMNRAATSAMSDVDVLIFVVEGLYWTEEDDYVLEKLKALKAPVILVINKTDRIPDKKALLPHIQKLSEKMKFAHIIPLSARTGDNQSALVDAVKGLLPEGAALYPEDQITDRSERFMAAEFVREKLMRSTGQEVPYAVTVEIEKFTHQRDVLHIHAVIWVEREGQKAIIIGEKGERLKRIGTQARMEMERMFQSKVFLQLLVRVKEGWSDDARAMARMGYE